MPIPPIDTSQSSSPILGNSLTHLQPREQKAPSGVQHGATLLFNWAGNAAILPPIPLQATVLTQKELPPPKVIPTAFRTIHSGALTGGQPGLLRFYDAIKPEFARLGARTMVKSAFQVRDGGFDQITRRVPEKYAPAIKAGVYAIFEATLVGPFDYLRTCRSIGKKFNWDTALKGAGANSLRQFLVWDVYFESRKGLLPRLTELNIQNPLMRDVVVGAGSGIAITAIAGPIDTAMRMVQLQTLEQLDASRIPRPRTGSEVVSDLCKDRLHPIKTLQRSTYISLFKNATKQPWPLVLGTIAKSPAIIGLALLTEVVQSGTLEKKVDSTYATAQIMMR